jgi:hypothetical protein
MTLPIFPSLPGITWPVKRKPGFNNFMQTGLSGQRTAVRFQVVPRWSYEIPIEFLRSRTGFTEFTDLLNIYLQCNGSFGTFLFNDLGDNTVTNQQIGAGFQERIAAFNGAPVIKVNGNVVTTGYSIDVAGVLTFTSPPPGGQVVAWTGSYYWVCRFDDDQLDIAQFMSNFWEVKTLHISSEIIT